MSLWSTRSSDVVATRGSLKFTEYQAEIRQAIRDKLAGDRPPVRGIPQVQGNSDLQLWRKAVDARVDHPYCRTKAQWRLERALIEVNPSNSEALILLDAAHSIAVGLKAQPLLEAIAATRENTSQ
jgi:hypothetical protein